jgi:hypothetical protein
MSSPLTFGARRRHTGGILATTRKALKTAMSRQQCRHYQNKIKRRKQIFPHREKPHENAIEALTARLFAYELLRRTLFLSTLVSTVSTKKSQFRGGSAS